MIRLSHQPPSLINQTSGLFEFVCEFIQPCQLVVEVGCFAGVSTEVFARSGCWIMGVDPWGEYDGLDMAQIEREFDARMQNYPCLKVKMRSVEAAQCFSHGSFDVVYIDALHDYSEVLADITAWLPKVKKGGIISGHDYTLSGVQRAVNELLGIPDKVYSDTSWMFRV